MLDGWCVSSDLTCLVGRVGRIVLLVWFDSEFYLMRNHQVQFDKGAVWEPRSAVDRGVLDRELRRIYP